jgi:hypothetical protein
MTLVYPPTLAVAGVEMTADALNAILFKIPWGLVAAPIRTNTSGTPTAADLVEVRDTTITPYVFTARADRYYRVCYTGIQMNGATVSSRALCRIRDGGASTPNAASTLIAETLSYLTETSSAGRTTSDIVMVITLSAGTHTFAPFTQGPDSTITTPTSTTAVGRTLWVEDAGPI